MFTLTCQVDVLCDALAKQYAAGKSSNLYLGFRCFATDVLVLFCYNKSLEATLAPEFHADIVVASETMLPYLSLCKYSRIFVLLVHYFPAWLARNSGSPVLAALFHIREVRCPCHMPRLVACQISHKYPTAALIRYFVILHPQLLTAQVDAILRDPTELTLTPHPIIYHALLSPEANKGRPLPSRQSLLDEAAILLGAGADSTGVTLMVTAHYVLQDPQVRQRLEAELREAWPILEETPRYEVLEKLPYLVRPRLPGERNFLHLPYLPLLIEILSPYAGRGHEGRSPHVPWRYCAPTCRASRRCRDIRRVHSRWSTLQFLVYSFRLFLSDFTH